MEQSLRPDQTLLPEVSRWQSEVDHGGGLYLALEIPDARPGDPDYFVEPRNASEFLISVEFSEPFQREDIREATILVGMNEGGGLEITNPQPDYVDAENGVLYLRASAPSKPASLLIRIFDPTGIILSERHFSAIPGDINGDGLVDGGDLVDLPSLNGQAADASAVAIRSDVDVDGTVSVTTDSAAVSERNGNRTMGDPPDMENPPKTVHLSFDIDPNSIGVTGSVSPMNVIASSTVWLPNDTTPGYTFLEWNDMPDGSGTSYLPGPTFTMPASDITLYAQWDPIPYSVTYFGNGNDSGSPPVDTNTYYYNDTVIVLDSSTLALASHSFAGWNTQPDGSGTSYAFTESFPITSNVDLYAQWIPTFAGGDGTVTTPYLIDSPQGLDAIRDNLTANYELVSDIDLGVAPWNTTSGWDPIGSGATPFNGTLEGNYHTIANLFVDRSQTWVGLFGKIENGTVNRLFLANANVNNSGQNTGILAGEIRDGDASVFRVGATGTVTVQPANYNVGGLAGFVSDSTMANDTIVESYSQVDVSGGSSVGGMVGFLASGSIVDSYSTGTVAGDGNPQNPNGHIGGLVGNHGGTIIRSYAAGAVLSPATAVGGLIGTGGGGGADNYYDETKSGQTGSTALYQAEVTSNMVLQSTFAGWAFGTIWAIPGPHYPYLMWQAGVDIPFP